MVSRTHYTRNWRLGQGGRSAESEPNVVSGGWRQRRHCLLLNDLGRLSVHWRDFPEACIHFERSLALWAKIEDRPGFIGCVEGIARLAKAVGKLEDSARLFGIADMMRGEAETPLPRPELDSLDREIDELRSTIGEVGFAAAWSDGAEMTADQAFNTAWVALASITADGQTENEVDR